MRAAILLWPLLWATTGFAHAQGPAVAKPSVRILFVGNSFTHGRYLPVRKYNAAAITDENAGLPADDPRAEKVESGPYGGIPGIFKKLTDEAGLNYEVHVEAVSAKNLAFHYKNALPIIAQPKWDVVVLQGYSTEPLPVERGGDPEGFVTNARRLSDAIRASNPHAKVYLEQTWPRADLIYPENAPYHGQSINTMVSDLRRSCDQAEAGDGPMEILVGDEWGLAISEEVAQADPYLPPEPGKLDLWGPDHYHPSIYGAYLSAVVIFCRIAGASQNGLRPDEQAAHDLGIAPADAARLQRYGAIVLHEAPPPRAARR